MIAEEERAAPPRAVGASVLRKEDLPLVDGSATFVGDIRLPGMLHAHVVRSLVAHARIESIDVSAALASAGVHAVVTARDIPEGVVIPIRMHDRPGLERFLQPVLARDTVRYCGEPVAVVVADSRYGAEDAAERVAVEYDELEPAVRADEALATTAAKLFADAGTNASYEWTVGFGDVERAFSEAATVVAARVECHRHGSVPLETRGLLAEVDESGTVTIHGAAKAPHVNRRILAGMLSLPQERLRLVEVNVGGGFGSRGEIYPEDYLIPWLALRLRRPVQWIEDRLEHLVATNHSREQIHELELALDGDGRFLGLRDRILNDAGAYVRTQGVVVPTLTASLLPGPYRFGAYEAVVTNVLTNKTPSATFRAPGRYEANLARERIVDVAAQETGIDGLELRRRNLIRAAEMPYAVGTESGGKAVVYDSGDYERLLDLALESFGYAGMRSWADAGTGPARRRGIGVTPFVEKSGVALSEYAEVSVLEDGAVTVATGATSFGQGLETVLAQICAEALGVDVDRVAVVHGDTATVADGVGTYGSRSSILAGSGVFLAAGRLRGRILEAARAELGDGAGELELAAGCVRSHGGEVPLATLAAVHGTQTGAGGRRGFVESETYTADGVSYPYGVQCAAVEVDLETGAVRVERLLVAYDIGRAINPALVRAQLAGGAVQGIGAALREHLAYDESGQLLAASFADYLLSTAPDVPEIEILLTEDAPSPTNPLGIKGAGEGGIAAVGAALASAVSDALGVQVTRLPLTPDSIRELAPGGERRARG